MKRLSVILFLLLGFSIQAHAQAIGVAYERQSEDPQNGFSARLEGELLSLPLISLNARAQFGFFTNDDVSLNVDQNSMNNISYDASTWDAAAFLIGEAGLPLPINVYAGVGFGYSVSEASLNGNPESFIYQNITVKDVDESSFIYNGLLGLKFSTIPFIKPFVEWRYVGFSNEVNSDELQAPSRFAFGINLEF
jgi:opacity protein-like surface antigen